MTSCACHIATHEGHGSAFCHTIGTGTDGDGRRLVWRARKGILPQNRGLEGAFVAFCCAA